MVSPRAPWMQVREVNRLFNQFEYRKEKRNHWATPIEFLAHGYGDCEDFAIAKFFALAALGITGLRLYLLPYSAEESHMVLVWPFDGTTYVLDCPPRLEMVPADQRKDLQWDHGFGFDCDYYYLGDREARGVRNMRKWARILDEV